MTERTMTSFKDFRNQVVDEAADAILPVLHDPDAPDTGDDDQIPALFATIHHYHPEHRPDGYTAKQIWELNNLANSHLPHLQQEWPYQDDHGEKLKDGYSHPDSEGEQ